MLKSLAIVLALSSFGLMGASSAQASCECEGVVTAAAPVPAPAATVTAQTPTNRTYRSYSYQPGSRSSSSMMPSYRSVDPAFRRADSKIFGR